MRRLKVLLLALLLIVLFGMVFLDPYSRVLGWVRGESFYQGRPTTSWSSSFIRGLSIEPSWIVPSPLRVPSANEDRAVATEP